MNKNNEHLLMTVYFCRNTYFVQMLLLGKVTTNFFLKTIPVIVSLNNSVQISFVKVSYNMNRIACNAEFKCLNLHSYVRGMLTFCVYVSGIIRYLMGFWLIGL